MSYPLYAAQADETHRNDEVTAVFSRLGDSVLAAFYSDSRKEILAVGIHHGGRLSIQVRPDVDRVILLQSNEGFLTFRTIRTAVGAAIVYSHIEDGVETLHSIDELPFGIFEDGGESLNFFAHLKVPRSFKADLLLGHIEFKQLHAGILREIVPNPDAAIRGEGDDDEDVDTFSDDP